MATTTNISVFLVEDDSTYASALVQYLGKLFKQQVRIETFEDGDRCVERIREKPDEAADVVILDYFLAPGSATGLEILKMIKAINSKITVVMLSAQDKLEIASESIRNGAYEYIVKSESAFIRTHNIIRNLLDSLDVARTSRTYEKWTLALTILILLLIIADVIYYMRR